MEEKERYIIDRFDKDIFDTKKEYYPSNQTICEIINKQDKRINELENLVIEYKNKLYRRLDQVDNLIKENHKLKQQLAKLKQKAIVPKFKIGQEIWEITPLMYWKIKRIEWHKFNGGNGDVVMEIYRLGHDGTDDYNCCIMPVDNDRFFATKEEAEQKLAEIKGEKDE